MNEIYWTRTEECPQDQLTKPGHATDAGYDIAAAEDALILPYSMIPFEWEALKEITELQPAVRQKLSGEFNTFFQEGSLLLKDKVVYRKKYKFSYVKTGIKVYPKELQWLGIYPRSSCSKYALGLGNHVGVVDHLYDKEIKLALVTQAEPTIVLKGERVAQLIPMVQPRALITEVPEEDFNYLSLNRGGRAGFGSTGTGFEFNKPYFS